MRDAPDAEILLRRLLTPLFGLLLLVNLWVGFKLCAHANSFAVLDWLINYQGGFVRRGLVGEVLLRGSHVTGIGLTTWVFLLYAICAGTYLYFSYRLLRSRVRLTQYSFLIFSPFLFRFPIHDEQGSFRKEILYFAILALNCWAVCLERRPALRRRVFYGTLALYPLVILSHEMLALFLPVIIAVHVRQQALNRRDSIAVVGLVLLSVAAFVSSLVHPVNPTQVESIRASLLMAGTDLDGALGWLARGEHYGMQRVRIAVAEDGYLFTYGMCALLAAVAFYPVRRQLASLSRGWMLAALVLAVVGSTPLFLVALDWGRFLNLFLVTLFLLSCTEPHELSPRDRSQDRATPQRVWLSMALLVVYSTSWHIPHCCGDSFLSRTLLHLGSRLAGML